MILTKSETSFCLLKVSIKKAHNNFTNKLVVFLKLLCAFLIEAFLNVNIAAIRLSNGSIIKFKMELVRNYYRSIKSDGSSRREVLCRPQQFPAAKKIWLYHRKIWLQQIRKWSAE